MTSPSLHDASADHAVGVELLGRHVQVADADALVRRVDDDVDRLLARRAHDHAVAHRHDVVLDRARSARPGRAGGNRPAGCPGPGGRAPRRIVRQRMRAVRRSCRARDRGSSVAIPRCGRTACWRRRARPPSGSGSWNRPCSRRRRFHLCAAAHELAGRIIGEDGGDRGRPVDRAGGQRLGRLLRQAADKLQRFENADRDLVGVLAGDACGSASGPSKHSIADHIGHAVADERVAHVIFQEHALDAGEVSLDLGIRPATRSCGWVRRARRPRRHPRCGSKIRSE